MRGRALPALLVASAILFACNALTGAGDLVADDAVDAGREAATTGDAAAPVPTTTSTQVVTPPPIDDAGSDAGAGHDAGVDAGKDAGPPILTGKFGGHDYEVVLVGDMIDWDDAKAAAEAKHGYLAVITSAAENAFVLALVTNGSDSVGGFEAAWLGGMQDGAAASTPDDKWGWLTNEAWAYTNWDGGEPNDGGGEEDFLAMYASSGLWNDWRISGDAAIPAYVVEYELGSL